MFFGWAFDYEQTQLDYVQGVLQLRAYECFKELIAWKFSSRYGKDDSLFDDDVVYVEVLYFDEDTNKSEFKTEYVDIRRIWIDKIFG